MLSSQLTNKLHSDKPLPLIHHMPSLERELPSRDKTLLSLLLLDNGPTISSKALMLEEIRFKSSKKLQNKRKTSTLLLRSFKFLNLMNTPTNLSSETLQVRLSTPWLLSLNSHISDKDQSLELDQPLMMKPHQRKFSFFNTTPTS